MHISQLKKYYFIDQYNPDLFIKLNRNISLIWRNKHKDNNKHEIIKTAMFCKKNNINLFLANNVKLALKLKLKGVYISASNNDFRVCSYHLFKKFKIIGSAHNIKELQIKKLQRIDEIFFAPIFKKKNNNPMGIYKIGSLFQNFKKDKLALGGVNRKNLKLLKLINFRGFAGINYFKKKGPEIIRAFNFKS